MSGSITFNEISQSNSLRPRTAMEIRPRYTNAGVFEYPNRTLLFCPKTAAGAGTSGQRFRITRVADATYYCGAGSIGEDMAATFMDANSDTELWGVVVAEPGGGAAAVGAWVFTAPPTGSGTVVRYINGRRYAYAATSVDTISTVAKGMRDAVNADPRARAVASWSSGGTCTLTDKHTNDQGNDIILSGPLESDERDPVGLAYTTTAMTGGSGTLSLTAAITAIAADWYTSCVTPVTDSTNRAALTTELARRYAATGHQDMLAFSAKSGTLSALTAYGPAANSQFLSVMAVPASKVEPDYRWATAYAAPAAWYLAQDPARQLRTLSLKGLRAPPAGNFLPNEQELLLAAGMATFVNPINTGCQIERAVSTRVADDQGIADASWRDIMTAATMSRIRYDFRTYWRLNYPRHKLASDNSPAAFGADDIMTPSAALGVWAGRCALYERLGWIVDVDRTLKLCRFQLPVDGTRNRMQATLVVRVIDNLMQTDMVLGFEA
jgi:phage tail sheath gpL-like